MSIHSLPKLPVAPLALAGALGLTLFSLPALAAYPDPPGGWTYKYNATPPLLVVPSGGGWANLDGTWTHDNGSDEFDGSEIGGDFSLAFNATNAVKNRPGGASLLNQSGVEFLRMQDPGDPSDYDTTAGEYGDPGSNRKVYFGHNIGSDIDPVKAQSIMDDGVTLTFRARIPTLAKAGGPLDPLHRDGQQANGVQPYPTNGDGYLTFNDGKGNFVVRQGGNAGSGGTNLAGALAFSFTQTTDTTGGNPTSGQAGFAGLTFNEFAGNVPAGNGSTDFGRGTKTNVVAFDPTDWHEIYIVVRKDPANIGTHEAFIFRDDNLIPVVFKMTAGTGADMPDSFIATGGPATGQNWALDVDWFGYKDEAVFPPGALLPPSLFAFAPADRTTFHTAASGLSFATSALMPTNTLPASGIKVILNGQDVSSQLVLSGNNSSQSRTVTFNGLQANRQYAATYIVTDSGGLSSTNDVSFDTFVEATATIVESEDYNHSSGQFIDDAPPGTYAGAPGTLGVDFVDTTLTSFGAYRTDAADIATSTDVPRTKFVTSGIPDYDIATIGRGEWWNYTRTLTNASYHVWVRAASTAAQAVRLDRVTSDPTQTNQTVQFIGSFAVPRTGTLNLFSYVQLTDGQGRPIAIPCGGLTTLRLTAPDANGDLALNYLLLQPAAGNASGGSLISLIPLPGSVGAVATAPVEATIYDGSNAVSQASVKLRVGGAEVGASVVKAGGVSTVKYTPATLWAPGTTYNLNLTFNDGAEQSFDWAFTTANYPVLTPAMKVTNATVPGFVWRMHQNEANQDATIQKAIDAISGQLGLQNLADPNATGPAAGPGTPATPGTATMTFNIPTVINVGQDTFGNFGTFTPDDQMPGIPGLNGGIDGIAVEITTFIQLPAGFITMVVNSDDGFRTTAGFLNHTPLLLDQVDGGRSSTDSIFQFAVQESGVYAFRTLYYEGGGNANLEWFHISADGTRLLINDTANGGAPAFQQGTIPAPPAGNVVLGGNLNGSGQLVLQWSSGTLLSSTNASGPYLPVAGATSPYVVNPAESQQKFFRVQVQ